MNHKIQNVAAGVFSLCIAVLTVFSIFSIWELVSSDVIFKSIETIGLIGVATLIVMVAAKVIGAHKAGDINVDIQTEGAIAIFRAIRQITVTLLIIAVTFAAFIGVMSIWDLLSSSVLHKSLSSMAILAFSATIISIVCLYREGNDILKKKIGGNGPGAGIMVFVIIILAFWFIAGSLFGGF